MNTAQRKYLVEKITSKVREKINELEAKIPSVPSLNSLMLHKVLSGDFDIRSKEELKAVVLKKALSATKDKQIREDWLGNSWNSASSKGLFLSLDEFFVLPKEFVEAMDEYKRISAEVNEEIRLLKIQAETLEVRITLASDKVLDKLLQEVDDMGDISLIDTKIKLLN